jgi:hypothetical protein
MSLRLTGAVALAVAIPAGATAATIRIEGGTGTTLPGTAVTVPGPATAQVIVRDTTDADTVTVPTRSATAQLARAGSLLGLPLAFDVSDFGTGPAAFITRIGTDAMPPSFSPSWRLKVNHRVTDTGADTTILKAGDSVLWSFAGNFEAPELDLSVTRRVATPGQPVDARVVAFDNTGAPSPAKGARIRFAGTTFRTGTSGRATLRATRPGTYWALATLPGAVRSKARLVCVHPSNTGAPCSAVAFPRNDTRTGRLSMIVGAVAAVPPATRAAARVDVALARLAGSRCRFLNRDRRTFTAPRDCRNRIAIPLPVAADLSWALGILPPPGTVDGPSGLPAGRYRVWSRQVSGTRIETRPALGMNTVIFTVAGE